DYGLSGRTGPGPGPGGSPIPQSGCLREAEAIRIPQYEVLDLLTALADKSLVLYQERDGEARYRLSETVRQYSRERLIESGEGGGIATKHRDHFLSLAEEAKGRLLGPEQSEWLEQLEADHDNL